MIVPPVDLLREMEKGKVALTFCKKKQHYDGPRAAPWGEATTSITTAPKKSAEWGQLTQDHQREHSLTLGNTASLDVHEAYRRMKASNPVVSPPNITRKAQRASQHSENTLILQVPELDHVALRTLILSEEQKIAEELRAQKAGEVRLRNELQTQLHKTAHTLPLDFARSHGLLDVASEKIAARVGLVLQQAYERAVNQAFRKWVYYSRYQTNLIRNHAATVLCSAARGMLARREFRRMKHMQMIEAKKLERAALLAIQQRDRAALVILRAVREGRNVRRRRELRHQNVAAVVISRWWRARKSRSQVIMEIFKRQKMKKCAINVQRRWRGKCGRNRARAEAIRIRVTQLDAKLSDPRSAAEWHLISHGAALFLQWWWRRCHRGRRVRSIVRVHIDTAAEGFDPLQTGEPFQQGHHPEQQDEQQQRLIAAPAEMHTPQESSLGRQSPLLRMHSGISIASPLAAKRREAVQKRSAIKIQAWIRRWLVQASMKRIRLDRMKSAARTIQRTVKIVKSNGLLKLWHCTVRMACKALLKQHRKKVAAAVRIQAATRAYMQRIRFKGICRLALKCQKLLRGWAATRRVAAKRERNIRLSDERHCGTIQYNFTLERHTILFLHSSCRKGTGEFKVLFQNCCGGEGIKGLDLSHFLKLVEDSPGLLGSKRGMLKSKVELVYHAHKPKEARHATLLNFTTMMGDIAEAHPALRGLERYGPLEGTDARLTKMMRSMVLKGESGLRAQRECPKGNANARAAQLLIKARNVIVSANRQRVNHIVGSCLRAKREAEIQAARESSAAIILQKNFRSVMSWRSTCELAAQTYVKCATFSQDCGEEVIFYYNKVLGTSFWSKPRLLGTAWDDSRYPICLPAGNEIVPPVQCESCSKISAVSYCVICKECYCATCSTRLHRAERNAKHRHVEIVPCDECEFQYATRICLSCKDSFCDCCFAFVHRKGSLRRHMFEPILSLCDQCGNGAQQSFCSIESRGLCRSCAVEHEHPVVPVRYEPLSAGQVLLEMKLAEEAEARAVEEAARAAAELEAAQHRAAATIQGLCRGFLTRKNRADFFDRRRQWLAQRSADQKSKARNIFYHVRDIFGLAPLYPTDTAKEVVLQRFPKWRRDVVSEVVPRGGYHALAQAERERASFQRQLKKGRRQWKSMWAQRKLAARLRIHEAYAAKCGRDVKGLEGEAKLAFDAYQAALAVGKGDDEVERLKMVNRRAKRLLRDAQEIHKAACVAASADQEELTRIRGPEGARPHIILAIRSGIDVGLVVELSRGSNYVSLPPETKASDITVKLPSGCRLRVGDDCHGDFWLRSVKQGSSHVLLELDRQWLASDSHRLGIRRMVNAGMLTESRKRLKRSLIGLPPFQFAVGTTGEMLLMIHRHLERKRDLHDEESISWARLAKRAEICDKMAQSVLNFRIHASAQGDKKHRGQQLRQQLQNTIARVRHRTGRAIHSVMSHKARARQARLHKDVEVALQSSEKEVMLIELDGTILCEADMDPRVPLRVLREYIRVRAGQTLNEKSIGEDFEFCASTGTAREANTTIADATEEQIDKNTRTMQAVIKIRQQVQSQLRGGKGNIISSRKIPEEVISHLFQDSKE